MFIGVAISGGGARAANFGLATLQYLKELGIYDDVTAISSVSGGSLAAATYISRPHETQVDVEQSKELLRTNFLSEWLGRATNPVNMVRSIGSGRNATRSLADAFDDVIFHDARYADLGKPGTGKPYLYINSAIINSIGGDHTYATRAENSPADQLQGFTFTNEAFSDLFSDLGKIRLADAVAASGAYPVVFDSITLQDYSPGSGTYARPKYLHVTDGGPADNLGVDALIQAYGQIMFGNPEASCLLIAVDAHVSDRFDQYGALADTRTGWFDFIVSPAFKRTFDLLLDRRREDQLGQLGVRLANDFPFRFVQDAAIPLGNNSFWSNGWQSIKARTMYQGYAPGDFYNKFHDTQHCAVWHIALDRLMELTAKGGRRYRMAHYGTQKEEEIDETPRDRALFGLDRFVNAIETNYHLTLNNGKRCSNRTIQRALFSAAFELTTQDKRSLNELTEWLRKKNRSRIADSIQSRLQIYSTESPPDANFVPTYKVGPSFFDPTTKRIDCQADD